ncbi:MAG: hypothetical protein RBU45_03295, partial [Myxococcota bacterium]|nr:hypothetical protein [Myxococcota bacterium]
VFSLAPAFRFLETLVGDDIWRMEGKVLTQTEVLRLNGLPVSEGVFLGESTYKVQEGFVGEVKGAEGPAEPASHPLPEEETGLGISQEMLARSLSDSLESTPPAAPDAPPASLPVAAPEAPPVAALVAAPVAVPEAAPVAPPVAVPVAPSVAPPEAAPVAPPEAAPVAPPIAAPEATPEAVPITPPATPGDAAAPGDPSDEDLLLKFLLENS